MTTPLHEQLRDAADACTPSPLQDLLRRAADALDAKQEMPDVWIGGEGWEGLAFALCADENGEDSCHELIWEGGPIPEPWGERWQKYEYDAKEMMKKVHKYCLAPIPDGMMLVPDIDWLSNVIREVDGSHNLGAGQLAEELVKAMLKAAGESS